MKNKPLLLLFGVFVYMGSYSQSSQPVAQTSFRVIQFHLVHRCVNCLRMEKFTRELLTTSFPGVTFELVNVEDKKNAKTVEQFQALGSALFLYNSATGRKKDVTAFASLNARDEAKYKEGLKAIIEKFIKS